MADIPEAKEGKVWCRREERNGLFSARKCVLRAQPAVAPLVNQEWSTEG